LTTRRNVQRGGNKAPGADPLGKNIFGNGGIATITKENTNNQMRGQMNGRKSGQEKKKRVGRLKGGILANLLLKRTRTNHTNWEDHEDSLHSYNFRRKTRIPTSPLDR